MVATYFKGDLKTNNFEVTGTLTGPAATAAAYGLVRRGVAVPNAVGANPTKAEFDALLASLRTAGIIAT